MSTQDQGLGPEHSSARDSGHAAMTSAGKSALANLGTAGGQGPIQALGFLYFPLSPLNLSAELS